MVQLIDDSCSKIIIDGIEITETPPTTDTKANIATKLAINGDNEKNMLPKRKGNGVTKKEKLMIKMEKMKLEMEKLEKEKQQLSDLENVKENKAIREKLKELDREHEEVCQKEEEIMKRISEIRIKKDENRKELESLKKQNKQGGKMDVEKGLDDTKCSNTKDGNELKKGMVPRTIEITRSSIEASLKEETELTKKTSKKVTTDNVSLNGIVKAMENSANVMHTRDPPSTQEIKKEDNGKLKLNFTKEHVTVNSNREEVENNPKSTMMKEPSHINTIKTEVRTGSRSDIFTKSSSTQEREIPENKIGKYNEEGKTDNTVLLNPLTVNSVKKESDSLPYNDGRETNNINGSTSDKEENNLNQITNGSSQQTTLPARNHVKKELRFS